MFNCPYTSMMQFQNCNQTRISQVFHYPIPRPQSLLRDNSNKVSGSQLGQANPISRQIGFQISLGLLRNSLPWTSSQGKKQDLLLFYYVFTCFSYIYV